jgi:hypothetical protein
VVALDSRGNSRGIIPWWPPVIGWFTASHASRGSSVGNVPGIAGPAPRCRTFCPTRRRSQPGARDDRRARHRTIVPGHWDRQHALSLEFRSGSGGGGHPRSAPARTGRLYQPAMTGRRRAPLVVTDAQAPTPNYGPRPTTPGRGRQTTGRRRAPPPRSCSGTFTANKPARRSRPRQPAARRPAGCRPEPGRY